MIFDFILGFLYSVINTILSALFSGVSDVSLPAGIASALTTAGSYLSAFDFIVPISSILAVFGVILTIETAIILFKALNWIIRKIPTIN
jgi:hypothetical protein